MLVAVGGSGVQATLVEQAQRGDHEAFGELAAATVHRLYAVASLILGDAELAQDAAQEALVRAWHDLPNLRDPARFDAWIHRVLVRTCADLGRRRNRWRTEVRPIREEPAEPDRSSNLADRDELERGLRHLNETQRTILVLTFYLGMTGPEAAETLDIPIGTAKSRLHYALDALRGALEADARSSIARVQEGRPA